MSLKEKLPVRGKFRLCLILCMVFAGFVMFPAVPPECCAQGVTELTPAKVKALLRCPTDDSRQFVDDAFALVRRGKIPEQFLLSAFNYAYKKPQNQWWYFEWVLTRTCQEAGLNLAKLRQEL